MEGGSTSLCWVGWKERSLFSLSVLCRCRFYLLPYVCSSSWRASYLCVHNCIYYPLPTILPRLFQHGLSLTTIFLDLARFAPVKIKEVRLVTLSGQRGRGAEWATTSLLQMLLLFPSLGSGTRTTYHPTLSKIPRTIRSRPPRDPLLPHPPYEPSDRLEPSAEGGLGPVNPVCTDPVGRVAYCCEGEGHG